MRTIAVMNQKGGVGKTTTSVNLAAGLAAAGRSVCLVDLDPQAHASLHLGVEALPGTPSLYDVMLGRRRLIEIRRQVAESLWVIPGNVDLAGVERELAAAAGRETVLRDALREFGTGCRLDYCLVDCPPSLGVLTINALAAVGEVFITLKHSTRTFVNEVDFVTTLGFGRDGKGRDGVPNIGKGPTRVITDLCVMQPDPETKELVVVSLHPGVTAEQVQEATGWEIRFAETLEITEAPSEKELAVLRELKARTDRHHAGE